MSRILKAVSLSKTPFIINHSYQSVAERDDQVNLLEKKVNPDEVIHQAELQAKELLESAKAEAAARKKQTLSEAEEIKRQAYDTAYSQGTKEGREQGLSSIQQEMSHQVNEAIQKAQNIIQSAHQEASSIVMSAERDIVELSIEIAKNVISGELMINSQAVLPIVRAALEKVKDQDNIKIIVNADDYEVVLAALLELQKQVTSHKLLELQVDSSIGMGGCVINTAYGSVDARIDTGLRTITTALREIMP